MKRPVLAFLSLTAFTALLATGCPPAEGEGEGDAAEGEGEAAEGEGEGEGEPPGEFAGCQTTCATDADCTDPNPADDLAVACDNDNDTCVFEVPTGGCTDDAECVAVFNGVLTCATVTDCPGGGAGQKCATFDIAGNSVTGCAISPADVGAGPQCFFGALTDATDEDAADAAIKVCVNVTAGTEDATCEAGVCTNPCAVDADCPAAAGFDVCTDGVCGCGTDDSKCAASVIGTQCVSNQCGCVTDDDCTVDDQADACFDGVCGCSGDSVCTEAGQKCLPFATFDASDVD